MKLVALAVIATSDRLRKTTPARLRKSVDEVDLQERSTKKVKDNAFEGVYVSDVIP